MFVSPCVGGSKKPNTRVQILLVILLVLGLCQDCNNWYSLYGHGRTTFLLYIFLTVMPTRLSLHLILASIKRILIPSHLCPPAAGHETSIKCTLDHVATDNWLYTQAWHSNKCTLWAQGKHDSVWTPKFASSWCSRFAWQTLLAFSCLFPFTVIT